ncbi:MAG: bile acid:sodium symporter family protein [Planctomycetaceae bacterium]|nr:bile acid:sodium symporter family protein [Planctomycetaceae bacterium]
MLQRYLLVWLTLLCGLALMWPRWNVSFDPFDLAFPWLKWMIIAAMFAIGCLLPRDEMAQVLKRWPTVAGGTAVQYITMPLIAWGVGHLAGLEGDWLLGIILVGCVPGAMASNVLTLAARGNVSYSVSLTTTATFLSPLIVPAVLYLLTMEQPDVDAWALAKDTFRNLLLQVFLPVVCGHLLARNVSWIEVLSKRWAPVVANLAILWIIAAVVNRNHTTLSETLGGGHLQIVWLLLTINLIGYCSGFLGGRLMKLTPSEGRALVLEVGMQNAGLGSVLAGQLFPEQKIVALPAALYTFGCMLTGTILAQYWSRRTIAEPVASNNPPSDT